MNLQWKRFNGAEANEIVKKFVPIIYPDEDIEVARMFAELITSEVAEVIVFYDDKGPVFLFQYGYFRNMVNFVLRKDYRGKGYGLDLFKYALSISKLTIIETAHSSYTKLNIEGKQIVDLHTIEGYIYHLATMVEIVRTKGSGVYNNIDWTIYFPGIKFVEGYSEKIKTCVYSKPEFDITM